MNQTESYTEKFARAVRIDIYKVEYRKKELLIGVHPKHVVYHDSPGRWKVLQPSPGMDFFGCVSYVRQKFPAGKYLAVANLVSMPPKRVQRTFTIC